MNQVIIYIQHKQKRVFKTCICAVVQRQKAASAYFTSKKILHLVSAEQCKLCTSNNDNIYKKMNNIVVEQYMLHCIGELLNIIYILFSSKVFLMYKFLNLINVSEDFMFSGKAFHIITLVYEEDL